MASPRDVLRALRRARLLTVRSGGGRLTSTQHEAIGAEILAMADEDQRMRRAAAPDRSRWDPEVDRRNTARLKEIVAEIGWPTRSKVGDQAEHMAWLLVQHADADRDFQRHCLELLEAAPPGEVCAKHIAYLEDRVRVGAGGDQMYGTQLRRRADGEFEPMPVEDPQRLDDRRAAMGLEPIAEYLASARRALGARDDPRAVRRTYPGEFRGD